MNNFENLSLTYDGAILHVAINRPQALNALNQQTFAELEIAVQEIYQNDKILGVIVSGAGEKAFAAGADIKEFIGLNHEKAEKLALFGQNLFQKIDMCHKPIIAAINGFALGGGCELAMACHIRIATKNSKLGLPETSLGIIPGYGGTQRLSQLVGKGKAMELILTGDMIDAQQAKDIGLVNHVVDNHEQLTAYSKEMMGKILSKGPVAIANAIKSINARYEFEEGYTIERNNFAHCATTEDFKEGTEAFIEKRKPVFKGK